MPYDDERRQGMVTVSSITDNVNNIGNIQNWSERKGYNFASLAINKITQIKINKKLSPHLVHLKQFKNFNTVKKKKKPIPVQQSISDGQ